MALQENINQMRQHFSQLAQDLEKACNGNKAACQRVRTGTIKLEKIAKKFRKESVQAEKRSGAIAPKKKTAPKKAAKKATAKKTAAKRPTAKKTTAKRPTAKKTAAKRPAAKKAASNRPAAKKTAPKKKAAPRARTVSFKRTTAARRRVAR